MIIMYFMFEPPSMPMGGGRGAGGGGQRGGEGAEGGGAGVEK